MAGRVFLLGAGFSKAICEAMPLMVELGAEVERALDGEGRSLPVSLAQFGGDFEQLLSYLADPQPWLGPADALRNRAAFLDVSRTVAQVLGERQRVAVRTPGPSWLQELVRYWDRMGSTVLTFNYDMLIEAAATEHTGKGNWYELYRAPVVPAASRMSAALWEVRANSFALLKLHGSLRWHWSGLDSISSDPIYDTGITGGWSIEGLAPALAGELDLERFVADKVPMVVPPTASKSAFYDNDVLRSQWQIAARALAEADELVIIGYSLPPSDSVIRSLLRTTFSGDMVIPVDAGRAVLEHVESVFGDRISDAFTGVDDPVAKFVSATCG